MSYHYGGIKENNPGSIHLYFALFDVKNVIKNVDLNYFKNNHFSTAFWYVTCLKSYYSLKEPIKIPDWMTTELRKPVLCNLSLLGKNTFDKKKSNHKQTNKQNHTNKQTLKVLTLKKCICNNSQNIPNYY